MWRNFCNFQTLHDCIVVNGIFKKYYYITLACPISCFTFFGAFKMIWPMEPNLAFCPQIWVFNAFLGFSSEDLGFLRFNCLAVI